MFILDFDGYVSEVVRGSGPITALRGTLSEVGEGLETWTLTMTWPRSDVTVRLVWELWLADGTGHRGARAITFLSPYLRLSTLLPLASLRFLKLFASFEERLPVLQARLDQHSSRERCVLS